MAGEHRIFLSDARACAREDLTAFGRRVKDATYSRVLMARRRRGTPGGAGSDAPHAGARGTG